MIHSYLTAYHSRYPSALVYMLQSSEYNLSEYFAWLRRFPNFLRIQHRRQLDPTPKARLLLLSLWLLITLGWLLIVGTFILALNNHQFIPWLIATIILILLAPALLAAAVTLPLALGQILIQRPRERRLIAATTHTLQNHPAIKIAVAGSYGKTTMKELLLTVLRQGKHVAATPANYNVAVSHARFAETLHGDEDILIIEYGESKPGDVTRFTATTHPNIGIITGLAPAHLDQYKTLQAAGHDIYSLATYLNHQNVFINAESAHLQAFISPGDQTYDQHTVLGWRIKDIAVSLAGISFTMTKDTQTMRLKSGLLGRHQVGPLALVAALGHQLGLTTKQVETGVAQTGPFEHRMQPRPLADATILDDTYNGNIEGMRAGLALLKELPAKRKWYVTPGLVAQGADTQAIHRELGRLIAAAAPDIVVLMQNSTTAFITAGLKEAGFSGQVRLESNPLRFYQGLEHMLAAGDLVLMQNDWTDNYA